MGLAAILYHTRLMERMIMGVFLIFLYLLSIVRLQRIISIG